MKVSTSKPSSPVNEVGSFGRSRPRANQPVVTFESLGDVRSQKFTSIPTALWNDTVEAVLSLVAQVSERFNEAFRLGPDESLLQMLQETIPAAAYSVATRLMEGYLRQVTGRYGNTISCHECGGRLDFEGYIERTVKTKMGPIKVSRAYYHGACRHSACPVDTALGIDNSHGVLPDLQEAVALLATQVSYPQALKTLQRILPVGRFSLHLEENVTETLASTFIEDQAGEWGKVEASWRQGIELEEKTVVVSVDGATCRVRDHDEKYREFKMAVLGELGANGVIANKTYVSTFGGADAIFSRTLSEYLRRNLDRATRLHGVTDGAEWIHSRMKELVHPGQEFTFVLDWFHSAERLKSCANELFPNDIPSNQAWYESVAENLYEGRLTCFFKQLTEATELANKPGGTLELSTRYFQKRRSQLCYKACRDQGLPIGSGAIEGAIRHVAKDRVGITGGRWNTAGAGLIIDLRCIEKSGRWEHFSQKQSEKRLQRFSELKASWLLAA